MKSEPTRDIWELCYAALCIGGPAFALLFLAVVAWGRCGR